MKIADGCFLYPTQNGRWALVCDDMVAEFDHLNDAVEGMLELAMVLALEKELLAKQVEMTAIEIKDVLEAYRHMVMTWFQSEVPDPHAIQNINQIEE